MKLALSILLFGLATSFAADSGKIVYENNFEKATVGSVPDDFLVLDGAFTVKEDQGNKFLELPGAPLETYGVLFGPTEKDGIGASARFLGTGKGRRYPAFAVGVNGVGGYKVRLSPSKKAIELLKGDAVKNTVPFEWESGKWAKISVEIRKVKDGAWKIEGTVSQERKTATINFDETEAPPAGRPSIWGNPFSGTPIQFDDLAVASLKG